MNRFKKVRTVLFSTFLLSTLTLTQACKPVEETPTDETTENETENPGNPENPDDPQIPPILSGAYADDIKALTIGSSCATYSWKNRGRAPAGYVKGVALSFARSLCRYKASQETPSSVAAIMSGARGSSDKDAITHYLTSFESLAIKTNIAGADPLRALYTLGMGLGMRESSGKYCVGWDVSAGSNRASATGEAGVFQTSYDSMTTTELKGLYAEYKASPERCNLAVFKEGATCGTQSILGTGAGADYQVFNKACPAFATEYAMVMLRTRRAHYGPINRKEAEVISSCDQLLKKVQTIVEDNPYACDDLI
jgi:hypothetical protein